MAFLGLTPGELFVVVFIVVAVVSAPYWPKVGAAIAVAIVGKSQPPEDREGTGRSGP